LYYCKTGVIRGCIKNMIPGVTVVTEIVPICGKHNSDYIITQSCYMLLHQVHTYIQCTH